MVDVPAPAPAGTVLESDAIRSALLDVIEQARVALNNGHHKLPEALDRAEAIVKGVRREFFVLITERDYDEEMIADGDPSEEWLAKYPNAGTPIVHEQYVNACSREQCEERARRWGNQYGWTRIGRVIVEDWPAVIE